jgi:two-component system OmpR family response regulator
MTAPRAVARVLVATADHDLRDLLRLALEGDGFEVSAVQSGTEAISAALARVPAAVLIDCDLGDLDGEKVLRNLRALDATRAVPAVFMVTGPADAERLASLRPDRDRILQKPFALDALLAAVGRPPRPDRAPGPNAPTRG